MPTANFTAELIASSLSTDDQRKAAAVLEQLLAGLAPA